MFGLRFDSFVKRLLNHGVSVNETNQLIKVAVITTIQNWNNKSKMIPVTKVIGRKTATITRVVDLIEIPISFYVSYAAFDALLTPP